MGYQVPIYLYVPNLLGYARILLAITGLHISSRSPTLAVEIWILAAVLDLFDGILARKFDQCSKFGILVDIAADNTLRTVTWIAAVSASVANANDKNSYVPVIATCIISLEWLTMSATQLHSAAEGGTHWKTEREDDPAYVKLYCSNNFRNPLGVLGMYGLFSCGMFTFGSYLPVLHDNVPYFLFFKYASCAGRLLSIPIELNFCVGYLKMIIENDHQHNETDVAAYDTSKKTDTKDSIRIKSIDQNIGKDHSKGKKAV